MAKPLLWHGVAPVGDAVVDVDVDGDPREIDAPGPCTTKVWATDFSTDPTQLDGNGDGLNDWRMRDGGTLPGTLANGLWQAPGSPVRSLDTEPKQDFSTRTKVSVRMRATAYDATAGAVFWINVDYTPTTFMPLDTPTKMPSSRARRRDIARASSSSIARASS